MVADLEAAIDQPCLERKEATGGDRDMNKCIHPLEGLTHPRADCTVVRAGMCPEPVFVIALTSPRLDGAHFVARVRNDGESSFSEGRLMFCHFDPDKAIQAAAVVMRYHGKRISRLRLLKLLYIADRTALRKR